MAKIKLKRYKKLLITRDCLVPKGAMEIQSIFKEDGAFNIPNEVIIKFDDSKKMMYNVMVVFGKADSQGMILDDEDVRTEALIDFQKNGDKTLKFTHKKDENDEPYDINAHVTEVYVVKSNDDYFPDYVGSIARCAYFPDQEEYNIIKELNFESSIEGVCRLETFEIDVEKKTAKAMHQIKDLLKKIFNIKIEKDSEELFNDSLALIEKDFDSILVDRQNNDVYFAATALATAIYKAEWTYIYDSPKDVASFKKEVAKIAKQFIKYINEMTFEVLEKENTNPEGEKEMDEIKTQAMIDKALEPLVKALGLEKDQTLADVITKAIGELKPSTPIAKDAEGNDIEIDKLKMSIDELVAKDVESQKVIKGMKQYMTDNPEVPPTDDEIATKVLQEERLKKATESSTNLI